MALPYAWWCRGTSTAAIGKGPTCFGLQLRAAPPREGALSAASYSHVIPAPTPSPFKL